MGCVKRRLKKCSLSIHGGSKIRGVHALPTWFCFVRFLTEEWNPLFFFQRDTSWHMHPL
jgi:hypothetical protein